MKQQFTWKQNLTKLIQKLNEHTIKEIESVDENFPTKQTPDSDGCAGKC